MRLPRTLGFTVLRECLSYMALGLLGVGSILITQNLLRQLRDVAEIGISLGDAATLVVCLAAMLAVYCLPIALLFGVLVTMGRLSEDSEIVAMRSLGVSLAQLAAPFVLLGAVGCGVVWLLVNQAEPAGRRGLRELGTEVAARGGLIEPGRFRRLDKEGRRLVFVEARGTDNSVEGVFLSDRSDPARPFTVVAERGRFSLDRESALATIQLENGGIHFEPQARDRDQYRSIEFGTFDYSWDMAELMTSILGRIPVRELDPATLRATLAYIDVHGEAPTWARQEERNRYEIEIERRRALSTAPLLLVLLGIPLGLRRARGARSYGTLLCVAIVFGYYALQSFGIDLAKDDQMSAVVALWLPNVVCGTAALALLWWARRSEDLIVGDGAEFALRRLRSGRMELRVDAALADRLPCDELLEPDGFERAFALSGEASGRAATGLLPLDPGDERVLLRRLRHGGVLGPILGGLYLGLGRCEAELRTTAALRAGGAPVPRPVLALAQRRVGPWVACAVGTVFEEDTVDALAYLHASPGADAIDAAARAAGRAVRRFHDAGGRHPDLHLKNLLLRERDGSTECLVIDLDRARAGADVSPQRRMRELMRLYRSLRKRGVARAVGDRGIGALLRQLLRRRPVAAARTPRERTARAAPHRPARRPLPGGVIRAAGAPREP